jgi:molecular chaperone DnaK
MLKDTGDKLPSPDKSAIESAMESVKKAAEGTDAGELQRALDQLTQAQHKAAEALYRSQAQPGGGPGDGGAGQAGPSSGASSEAPKGDVIDAEVVDEAKPQ